MKFKLELEAQDWQQVLSILGQGRFDQVAQLIGRISAQLQMPQGPPPLDGGKLEKPQVQ